MMRTVARLAMAVVLLAFSLPCRNVYAAPADLYVREINITGNEFLVLEAGSDIADLGNYWIGYVNDNLATAAPSQQLPVGIALTHGQSIILTGNTVPVCDSSVVSKLSFSSFNNSKGAVAVWHQAGSSFSQIESATWKSSSGANINTSSESGMSNPVWYNDGSESWKVGDFNNCQLTISTAQTISWPTGAQPPVSIVSISNAPAMGGIPAADIGLAAPQITELLPNPASPQTDADDEFIELYNPNESVFDLSGFTLEIGTTTKHDYTFDAGTSLPAKGFVAFYSADTHLSLSNSGSQVWLLDPPGNIISQADAYTSAKDGQAWALANGKWYWTSTPTPNAANLINGSSLTSGSKTSSPTAVKAASTGSSSSTGSFSSTAAAAATPIHPWTLVGIGAAALLYAGYEYRTDLANNVYRLRRYYETRRTGRTKPAGRRSYRTALRSWRRQNHLRPRTGKGRKK